MMEATNETDSANNTGIGWFRIKKKYWLEAVAFDSNLTANGETFKNCTGEEGIEYSKKVVQVQQS